MNLNYFPHFIRKNFPETANESNEDLIEIGKMFKSYLQRKYAGKEDKLNEIWNIDPETVICNETKSLPFKTNGYHPALILHFHNFIKKEAEKCQP